MRARAYLDINCGHCHNRRGPADTSGLALDASETSRVALGLCKSPIAAGRGTGDRRFAIVPGQPDESITVYRMGSTDPGSMMPELGRSLAHGRRGRVDPAVDCRVAAAPRLRSGGVELGAPLRECGAVVEVPGMESGAIPGDVTTPAPAEQTRVPPKISRDRLARFGLGVAVCL